MSAPQDFQFIQVSVVENVLLFRWGKRVADVPTLEPVLDVMKSHFRVHDRASFLARISDDSPMQPEDVRDFLQRELRALDAQTICSATVITREGFIGSALRAAVGTMQLLSRVTHPTKIFQRPDEAVRWLRAQHDRQSFPAPSEAALLTAFRAQDAVARVAG